MRSQSTSVASAARGARAARTVDCGEVVQERPVPIQDLSNYWTSSVLEESEPPPVEVLEVRGVLFTSSIAQASPAQRAPEEIDLHLVVLPLRLPELGGVHRERARVALDREVEQQSGGDHAVVGVAGAVGAHQLVRQPLRAFHAHVLERVHGRVLRRPIEVLGPGRELREPGRPLASAASASTSARA